MKIKVKVRNKASSRGGDYAHASTNTSSVVKVNGEPLEASKVVLKTSATAYSGQKVTDSLHYSTSFYLFRKGR